MPQAHEHAAKAYRAAIAASSSSLHTLLFLYDMMIADLLRAKETRERGQLDQSLHALGKASRIALALPTTLDRARAGDLAQVLERFYLGLSCRIIRLAQRHQPLEQFDRMIGELRDTRATWQEVARLAGEDAAARSAQIGRPSTPAATGVDA